MRIQTALVLLITSSAFVIASCSPSGTAGNRASDTSALRAADEQWSAIAAKNDLDGTLAFYADNAVLLAPNAPIATDRKAIRESWAGLLAPNTAISWKASEAKVASSGELGYVYGTYSLAIQDPKGGTPTRDIGKFVEIWNKEADGKWKCIVDTYNSDVPATPAAEAKK